MPPSREPVGERVARVETKVDLVLERLDGLAPMSELVLLRTEVDDVKSSRRWAVGTFLSVGIALMSFAVAAFTALHGGAA